MVWKIFNKFFVRLDIRPTDWNERLTLFVGYLIQDNKQSSTVKSYISAIKAVLQQHLNIKLEEDTYLLSALTKVCRLQNDMIKTRLPIQKGMLSRIQVQVIKHYESEHRNQLYLSLLYQTIFSTMYFGLLRVSEVAGQHSVLAQDIHIGYNKKKFLLILRTSKTHWKNMKPQIIKIQAKTMPMKGLNNKRKTVDGTTSKKADLLPCLYNLLRNYAASRGGYVNNREPFFIFCDLTPVKSENVNKCLQTIIRETGINPVFYSSHSIRSGRTTDLYELGLSVESIKKMGWWRSNAVYRYLQT